MFTLTWLGMCDILNLQGIGMFTLTLLEVCDILNLQGLVV